MSSRDFNDVINDIVNSSEQRRVRQLGFTRGYSLGEEAGWRDGYCYGVRKGAQLAAEIGFYQGFIHAYLAILEKDDSTRHRKLSALKNLLDLIRTFSTDVQENDSIQKLEKIRLKFKHLKVLLNCGTITSSFEEAFTPTNPAPHTRAASFSERMANEMSF